MNVPNDPFSPPMDRIINELRPFIASNTGLSANPLPTAALQPAAGAITGLQGFTDSEAPWSADFLGRLKQCVRKYWQVT